MAYETGTLTTAKAVFDRMIAQLKATAFMGAGNEWTAVFEYDGWGSGEARPFDSVITIFQVPGSSGSNDWYIGLRLTLEATNTAAIYLMAAKTMDAISLGGTSWNHQGDWSSASVSYVVGDVVDYSGFQYVCKTAHTSTATTPASDPITWQSLSSPSAFLGDAFMNPTNQFYEGYTLMWNGGTGDIKYWLVADQQRVILVTKSDSRYHFMYAGGIDTPLPLSTYGMPVILTRNNSNIASLYSDTGNGNFPMSTSALRLLSTNAVQPSSYSYLGIFPYDDVVGGGINPNGDRALLPVSILLGGNESIAEWGFLGALRGVFYVDRSSLISEDIITISSQDYLAIENVYRGSSDNYLALRLS